MPKFIIKMEKDGEERYLEWSTIVDAPVTYGMTYDEFLEYYRVEYGAHSMDNLVGEHGRMQRVHAKGTSERDAKSVHDTIIPNRADDKETELTYDEIWQKYVVERPQNDKESEPEPEPEPGPEPGPEDTLGDFNRLRAMLSRADIEFRETLKSGERIVDLPMGSTVVRFVCGPDGRLQSVELPRAVSGL